ncbi:MAG: hypothetical protein ACE37D_20160, partial [Pseudomonadales bacterium]
CNGNNPANYGPYDYMLDKDKLKVVENYHFRPETEALMGGGAGLYPSGGIDYTLTVIPNHHRALNSAIRLHFQLALRSGRIDPKEALRSPAECYLQRAVNYAPGDATSHMLYGVMLHRSGRMEEALVEYRIAMKLAPGAPVIEYNYALALADKGQYADAKQIATKLYDGGYPLPGLKNKLKAAGSWE